MGPFPSNHSLASVCSRHHWKRWRRTAGRANAADLTTVHDQSRRRCAAVRWKRQLNFECAAKPLVVSKHQQLDYLLVARFCREQRLRSHLDAGWSSLRREHLAHVHQPDLWRWPGFAERTEQLVSVAFQDRSEICGPKIPAEH